MDKIFFVLNAVILIANVVLIFFLEKANCCTVMGFDAVPVLSILVTVLVSWNIYQLIDLKEQTKRIDDIRKMTASLKEESERERNYIHNKTDYNQALSYIFRGSLCAEMLVRDDKDTMAALSMMQHSLNGIKMLAKFPDENCIKEIKSAASILTNTIKNGRDYQFTNNNIESILYLIYDIRNWHNIPELMSLKEALESFRKSC